MIDILSRRLEKKERHNLRAPLAVQTLDGKTSILTPSARDIYTFMADPDFWQESDRIEFLWGTESLTARLAEFRQATYKA
jgi:hypothetical protein